MGKKNKLVNRFRKIIKSPYSYLVLGIIVILFELSGLFFWYWDSNNLLTSIADKGAWLAIFISGLILIGTGLKNQKASSDFNIGKAEHEPFYYLTSGIIVILLVLSGLFFRNIDMTNISISIIEIVAWFVSFISSLFLMGFGIKTFIVFSEKEIEDISMYYAEATKFKLKEHYKNYCNMLDSLPPEPDGTVRTKEDEKPLKYSTWVYKLRTEFNQKLDEEKIKQTGNNSVRGFTLDMKYSLKRIKRNVARLDDLYKTVLLPGELGFIAIVCTTGLFSDVAAFVAAVVFTLVICLLFGRMIVANHRILSFVDDVVEVLGIDIDKDIEEIEKEQERIDKEKKEQEKKKQESKEKKGKS